MRPLRLFGSIFILGLFFFILWGVLSSEPSVSNTYGYAPTLTNAADEGEEIGRLPQTSGFGVLGDSNSDEYRADNDRGSPPWEETTLNFVELLARHRNLNFGPWGTRPEPRRTGYAYNWSRSGATAETLVGMGQHTGLASQIRQGEVSHVFFRIGANDFAPYPYVSDGYVAIYSGALQGEALQTRLDEFVSYVHIAVDTLAAAGSTDIVLANVFDYNLHPIMEELFPDPIGRARFTEAISYVNAGLSEIAASHSNVTLVTHDSWVETFIYSYPSEFIEIGGVLINVMESSDAPTFFVLGDGIHLGTVAQGLVANEIVLKPFNEVWGLGIEPFSEEELVSNAGISLPVSSSSPTIESPFALHTYPNPASKHITIEFTTPDTGLASLEFFDSAGRKVATPLTETLGAGTHTLEVDISGWPAGAYTYILRHGTARASGRMIVVE